MKVSRWAGFGILLGSLCASLLVRAEGVEARNERGPLVTTLRLGPPEPRLGDPLELELEVRAEPGVEVWMPEFGDALGRFSIVDFVPSESVDDDGSFVGRQRYVLHPPRSGAQRIPPLMVEFVDRRPGQDPSPEGEDAYSMFTDALVFEVASVLPEGASLELRAPKGALLPQAFNGEASWIWVGAAAFAIAAALAIGAAVSRRRGPRTSAYEIARRALDELGGRPRPRASEMDAFYVEVSGIARRYLEGHFGLRAPELTTEEFLVDMSQSPDLSREHRQLMASLLQRADLVKFARERPDSEGAAGFVEEVRRFVEETGAVGTDRALRGAA